MTVPSQPAALPVLDTTSTARLMRMTPAAVSSPSAVAAAKGADTQMLAALMGAAPRGRCAAEIATAVGSLGVFEDASEKRVYATSERNMRRWTGLLRPFLRHKACPPPTRAAAALSQLRPGMHNSARAGVSTWGGRPSELWEQIVASSRHSGVTPATRTAWALVSPECSRPEERAKFASACTVAGMLLHLCVDETAVRAGVATNPAAPAAALAALADDPDPGIRKDARSNPNAMGGAVTVSASSGR